MGWINPLILLRERNREASPPVEAPASELLEPAFRPGTHIPALDAVRGLAIVLVTLYRFAGVEKELPGADQWLFRLCGEGYRGVDLFFVLSGFLITGILFDAKGKPGYFRNFYMRRSLRIFPLYYGTLLLFLVALPLLGSSYVWFPEAQANQAWLWLYGSNVLQGWTASWNLGYFNHFWSLAVEEHFYFVWPLVIFCCTRKQAVVVCVATIVLTLAIRAAWIVTTGNDVAMEVCTWFRMDGLALGGLLALAIRGPGGLPAILPTARVVAAFCGAAIVGLMLLPNGRLLGLPMTLFAVFFGSMILLAVNAKQTSLLGRFWNSRVLQFFGKYSYAMYVFQNLLIPLLAGWLTVAGLSASVGSPFWGRLLYIALMSAATTLVALASWNLYEKHFLKLKRLFGGH